MRDVNDTAAVIGVGMTEIGDHPGRTVLGLAADALQAACADAGIDRTDIDGFVWNLGHPTGEDYDRVTEALGLRSRFTVQTWTHGRFTGTAIIMAALAVATGQADVIACLGGIKRRTTRITDWGAPHPENPRNGIRTFADDCALTFRRYLDLYKVDPRQLGNVVVASRAHASRNPLAFLREPLSLEQYAAEPFSVAPLRDIDCFPHLPAGAPRLNSGICVLITRADMAADLNRSPVFISAMQGVQTGRQETYFGRPGLGLFSQPDEPFVPSKWDLAVYNRLGVSPSDIDGFYTYDAFSPLVWYALERFGHCQAGKAYEATTLERIGPDGSFPINTHGGMLSEGHTASWGAIIEIVRQLRHEAGPRQITDVALLQWGSVFGDSIIFSNEQTRGKELV
jgi:acetyl-CoA acetyltransferase